MRSIDPTRQFNRTAMKLTLSELSLIIELLDKRRIYFEGRSPKLAKQAASIITKLSKSFYK